MSGHSKWHNIQQRKGKQDALRSNLFTKYAKLITVAAKTGGADATTNFSLRLAVEKAKAVGMPKDNIEKAIKRGTGELAGAAQVEEILYETFGPSGVAIIIKALTDNKNRTVSDLKYILSQHGGSMGGAGSVMWMFSQMGVISISNLQFPIFNLDKESFELVLIEAGAEDITEDGEIEIKTKVENFQKVLGKLKELGLEPLESGLQLVAKDKIKVDEATRAKLEGLFGDLEVHDDVENYWTNAE